MSSFTFCAFASFALLGGYLMSSLPCFLNSSPEIKFKLWPKLVWPINFYVQESFKIYFYLQIKF